VTPERQASKGDDGGLGGRLRQLAGAAGILMISFVASRALGFVRTAVLAGYFGDSPQYEAYVAAIAVPDAVFQVLAGGVMGAAFIPVFARYLAAGDEEHAWRLSSSAINLAALLTGAISLLLIVFARPVMGVVVSGRDADFQELATGLVRIMLISPAVFAVSGFATSILNTYQRFFWAGLAPLMYNLGIIAGTVFLHDRWGIYGVAIGVAAGAVGHLLIQAPGLVQIGARYRPVLDWREAGVREVGKLMLPRMFGLGVAQANQLITNIFLASFLVAGSMAYLNYAWLVLMLPLGVFGMAVSTAVFPTLARHTAAGEEAEMGQLFGLTLRVILYLTIPAAVGLIVLGGPIVRLLFERGSFTPALTQATAIAVACYALGLPGHSVVEIVDRAFYALHDTRTPVKAAALAVLLNIALSGTVVFGAVSGAVPAERAYAGLALANAIAAWVEASLLVGWLHHRAGGGGLRGLGGDLARYVVAALVMGAVLAGLDDVLLGALDTSRLSGELVAVGTLIAVGLVVYLVGSLLLRSREPRLLLGLLRRR
jgi:putative peptidoglycan lipid II flippase